MPKLKFPARHLFRISKGKGRDLSQQSVGSDEGQNKTSEGEPNYLVDRQLQDLLDSSAGPANDSPAQTASTRTISRGQSFSPWIGADFFICINVKEGIDLFPSVPVRPATCDSFVRVALQRPDFAPIEEAETRVLPRNCYPLWEECLPFPLDHVTEDTCIVLRVLDKDIGHFNSFLGAVSLPIKDVLLSIQRLDHERIYRMPLLDRHSHVRKRGELVFGVSVVAKHEYKEMRTVITSMQDPDQVYDSLRDFCLHIKLHRIKELWGLSSAALASLAVEFSLCSYELRKPLTGQLVGGELDPEDVTVVVPLGAAFQEGDTLKGKSRAQFGDVKIDILAGKTRIAKTQVPIWDVPFHPGDRPPPAAGGSGSDSDSDSEEPEEGGECKKTFITNITGLANAVAGAALGKNADATTTSASRILDSAPGFRIQRSLEASGSRVSELGAAGSPSKDEAGPPGPPASPPPPRLWDGKLYSRRMERTDRNLTKPPVVLLSMHLVKADVDADGATAATASGSSVDRSGGGGGGGSVADLFAAADVDSPAEHLSPPAPVGMSVAEFVVGAGPSAVMRAMYGDGSEVSERVAALEKTSDIKVSPWGPDPDGKALAVRTMSYLKPTVVGPTAVNAVQKLIVKCDGGFVVHQYVTPTVPPAGQCVRITVQVVCQHIGPGKSRVTVSYMTHWFKSGMVVNMLKGKVEDGTPKDTRKFFTFMRRELNTKFGMDADDTAGAVAASGVDDAAAAAAAVSAGPCSVAALASGGGVGASSGLTVSTYAGVTVLAMGLVLLLVLLRVSSDLGRSRRAVEEISRDLQELVRAVEGLAARLLAVQAGAQQQQAVPPAPQL